MALCGCEGPPEVVCAPNSRLKLTESYGAQVFYPLDASLPSRQRVPWIPAVNRTISCLIKEPGGFCLLTYCDNNSMLCPDGSVCRGAKIHGKTACFWEPVCVRGSREAGLEVE